MVGTACENPAALSFRPIPSASSSSYSSGVANAAFATEVEVEAALAVAHNHRFEHRPPALGVVHVAGPERAALEIAEMVEHKQRVVAATAKVADPGSMDLRRRIDEAVPDCWP